MLIFLNDEKAFVVNEKSVLNFGKSRKLSETAVSLCFESFLLKCVCTCNNQCTFFIQFQYGVVHLLPGAYPGG